MLSIGGSSILLLAVLRTKRATRRVARRGPAEGTELPRPGPIGQDRRRRSRASYREVNMALRKYIIERDIPAVGSLEREQLRGAAAQSNGVLRQLGSDIQWVESYVAADKTFCVYLARDEEIVKEHAKLSGFPATKITEVRKMIDPTTEHAS
jgi:hypothetical protein